MTMIGAMRQGAIGFLILLLRVYQYAWSSMTPPSCRYWPSCSAYAVEAIRSRGPVGGIWLAARRLARCGPGGGWGYDPVPVDPKHGIGF